MSIMICELDPVSTSPFEQVRDALGSPAVELPGVLLYLGDCLKLMPRLPRGIIDLTVTSPPYNIGKEYESIRETAAYVSWCRTWMTEIHRLTAPAGAFWLNLGYFEVPGKGRAVPIPYLLWNQSPFYLQQEVVWNYGAGVAARKSFAPRNEKFLWFLKDVKNYAFNLDEVRDPNVKYPNQKKNGKLKCNPLGKNPTDVWQFPKVTSGKDRSSPERTDHPAQFPVGVIDRIVRACSSRGELVLDPFMGSGTVAEVGIRSGRLVLGFELQSRYVDITYRRLESVLREIEQASAQNSLF